MIKIPLPIKHTAIAVTLGALLVLTGTIGNQPALAAPPNVNTCNTDLQFWDWPRSVNQNRGWNYTQNSNPLVKYPKTGLSPWVTGSWPVGNDSYSYDNSWFIAKGQVGGNDTTPVLVYSNNPDVPIVFDKIAGVYKARRADNAGLYTVFLTDRPPEAFPTDYQIAPVQSSILSAPYTLTDLTCISARNPTYTAAWDLGKLSNNISYEDSSSVEGSGSSLPSCKALDIGCKITEAMNAVGNTIKDVMTATLGLIADLFTFLFVPDGQLIQNAVDAFQSALSAQMGLLGYPVTFFANLFTSILDQQGSTWCNGSNCTENFGTFYGANFSIDFLVVKHKFPTLWEYMLIIIRGGTIVALMFMVRNKYLDVMGRARTSYT